MGCDGGTIPKRHELIKKKEKKESKDKQADTAARWRYCAASSNRLNEPVVSCELGRLYNKDAVLEYLLNKDSPNASMMKHIRNLKDVITLKLTRQQEYKPEASNSKGGEASRQDSEFVCPIANIELNGQYKFYTIRSCGCVFSERALKNLKTDTCLVCSKPFIQDDLILLNGNDEEVRELETKMNERRAKAKEAKKSKRKADSTEAEASGTTNGSENGSKKPKIATSGSASSSTLPSTSVSNTKTSAQVLGDQASKGFKTVGKDPKATEAYKSLFTSHESAKSKPKNNWVTFNPLYN